MVYVPQKYENDDWANIVTRNQTLFKFKTEISVS